MEHRRAWLDQRRAAAEDRFDQVYAPTYDADDTPITGTHRRFIDRLIESVRPGGTILDAPCGTGRYLGLVLDAGRQAVGADQSAGMLAQARARYPDVPLEKIGLQELAFRSAFDAVLCVDSMEFVSPEDWPLVLANLRRAVRPGALLYLTVEQIAASEIDRAFEAWTAEGLPVARGETPRGGGYHFYPSVAQVDAWLAAARLAIVDEGRSDGRNYWYRHLLLQRRPDPYEITKA